jgi:hypothetical protein
MNKGYFSFYLTFKKFIIFVNLHFFLGFLIVGSNFVNHHVNVILL